MRRFHHFALWLMVVSLLGAVLPVTPAHAAPVRQQDDVTIANRIAGIRDRDPDVLDTFSRDAGDWELAYDSDGSIYYRSGHLRIAVDTANTLLWTQSAYDVGDYYLELDARHEDGVLNNQVGVIFRFVDADNYYIYSIGSDGYYSLFELVDNEWQALIDWRQSDLVEAGADSFNTLGLLVEDDHVVLLVNDYILDQADLPTTEGLGIGLAAGAFDDTPVDIGFDELRIWQLDAPEPAPTRVRVPGRITPTPVPDSIGAPTEEPTEESTAEATVTAEATGTVEPAVTAEPTATVEPTATDEPTATGEADLGYANSILVNDPAIAAIQAETPTYVEEFDQEPFDWSPNLSEGIEQAVVDGALQFDITTPSSLGWIGLPDYPVRYYLEVDIAVGNPIVEAEYGILFNYQNAQNFDFFAVDTAGQYSLWRLADNEWTETLNWAAGSTLESGPNSTNRIGLLVDGSDITLVANGEVLDTLEEPEPRAGALALVVGTFAEGGLQVRFDNVALWDLAPGLNAEPNLTPTLTATPAPTLTPAPTATEIDTGAMNAAAARIEEIQGKEATFSDDFRRDTRAWDTDATETGLFFFERRALHTEVTGPNRSAWAIYVTAPNTPAEIGDFYIEFDATFVTAGNDNAAGLVFRMADDENYYLLSAGENGYINLVKRVDGNWIDLTPWTATETIDITPEAVNRIGILAEGTTIAVAINGEVVTAVEDTEFSVGALGLLAQAFTATSAEVSFDNVVLWILDDTE